MPDKLAIAIADESSEFRPHPVMHTYATHTPRLTKQNAAFYRSATAVRDFLNTAVKSIRIHTIDTSKQ